MKFYSTEPNDDYDDILKAEDYLNDNHITFNDLSKISLYEAACRDILECRVFASISLQRRAISLCAKKIGISHSTMEKLYRRFVRSGFNPSCFLASTSKNRNSDETGYKSFKFRSF